MGLGLLLIPALGGYWFLTHYSGTRHRMRRTNGYDVVLRSAVVGMVLFAIARILAFASNGVLPQIGEAWQTAFPFDHSGTSALAVALGMVAPVILNRRSKEVSAQRRVAKEDGNLIELMVNDSIDRGMMVEVSLQSGKSYIGIAMRVGIPDRDHADMALVPMMSGHRDKNTAELHITDNYGATIQSILDDPESPQHLGFDDFQVIVPLREVISVRLFDPVAYRRLNADDQRHAA